MLHADMRRRRILFLTDIPYWEQAVGSHSRIATLIAGLAPDHDVAVLNLHDGVPDSAMTTSAALDGAAVFSAPQLVETETEEDNVRTEEAARIWPWFPVDGRWLTATAMLCEDWRPDIVVVEYIRLAYLLSAVPDGAITLLDSHDVMSHRMALFATYGHTSSIIISARNEAEIMRRFDVVIAISRFDVQYLREHLHITRLLYVPHVMPPFRGTHAGSQDGRSLIFVAGQSEANRAGLRYFLREIWPPLSRSYRLRVCGSISEDVAVSGARGVDAMGHVPDLDAEYARADIAINPVFMGGGLKIKTVEAMNAGLPCVTTAEGARGLIEAAPDALAVVEDRIRYLDTLIALSEDAERRRGMGDAARAFIKRHFSPDAGLADIRTFLRHV